MNEKIKLHDEIILAFHNYCKETESFENGIKAAAPRARKALQDLNKLTTLRRKEIQEQKKDM